MSISCSPQWSHILRIWFDPEVIPLLLPGFSKSDFVAWWYGWWTFTRHFGGVSCISIVYAILESTTDLEADTRQLPSCRTSLIEEAAPTAKRLCRISTENPPQDFLSGTCPRASHSADFHLQMRFAYITRPQGMMICAIYSMLIYVSAIFCNIIHTSFIDRFCLHYSVSIACHCTRFILGRCLQPDGWQCCSSHFCDLTPLAVRDYWRFDVLGAGEGTRVVDKINQRGIKGHTDWVLWVKW